MPRGASLAAAGADEPPPRPFLFIYSEPPGHAESRHPPDDGGEERPLPWCPVPTLLSTDTYGVPIFSPSQTPVVQLQVTLHAAALQPCNPATSGHQLEEVSSLIKRV